MNDFLSRLLDRYGLVRLAIGILIGFFALWALAHFTAAPGGNVSVLWGLVQYTKSKPDTSGFASDTSKNELSKHPQSVSQSKEPLNPSAEGQPISGGFEVTHGVTKETCGQELRTIRTRRQLRPLQLLESGRSVSETARGTYFSVFLNIITDPKRTFLENLDRQPVQREAHWIDFEIHLPKTGVPIIMGFVAESDAVHLTGPTLEIRKISMASFPSKMMTSMVSLPADRVASAKVRMLDVSSYFYVLDLEIK